MRRASSVDVRGLRLKSWQVLHEASSFVMSKRLQQMHSLLTKYSPDQPRVPAGSSAGGQWTSGGGADAMTNKPEVTVHTNTRITIYYPDGTIESRSGGSRAWRNNNPGNIRAGSFANRHGAIGNKHGFAVFSDEATGRDAHDALLKGPNYSGLTVDEAVARRSPPNENETSRTQQLVRQFSGLSGTEKINELNPDQFNRASSAIIRAEGWRVGAVSRTQPDKDH